MSTRAPRDKKSGADSRSGQRGLYKMRTVSRITGYSPVLLRAWETRHGFLAPVRTPSGHRLYTESDLRVLARVAERIEAGQAIGEIAALGRATLLAESTGSLPTPPRAAPSTARAPRGEPAPRLSQGELAERREAIVDAAVALDGAALDAALAQVFERAPAAEAIAAVVQPAAVRLGDLWAAGRISVASEHLASARFTSRLHDLVLAAEPAARGAPRALVACLPDELHELGALIVGYHLCTAGYRVLYLGANLPLEDVERACDAARPRLVALSAAREAPVALHGPRLVELVRRSGRGRHFWLGGAGVSGDRTELVANGLALWPGHRPITEAPFLRSRAPAQPGLGRTSPTSR